MNKIKQAVSIHRRDRSEEPCNKEDILSYVRIINEKLKMFIQSTLEVHELQDVGEYNLLPNEVSLKGSRCWEELRCGLIDCPAYKSQDYRCWLVAGTLCGGGSQGTFAQKSESCYSCKVFRKYTDTSTNELYENIGIIIRHLGDTSKKLREYAIKDNLTGLYNRNYLNLIEEREIQNAGRGDSPVSIILFDLNKFKIVNDTYGHLIGDEMLRQFSDFLRKYTRRSELIFRFGGDEFMILINGADENKRKKVENRFLDNIDCWNENRKGSIPVPITFSLGGATLVNPLSLDDIIAESDKRLYFNKKNQGYQLTK